MKKLTYDDVARTALDALWRMENKERLMKIAPRAEAVNHPAHYGGDVVHEHYKCATAWGLVKNAFLYNASKYIFRFGKKGTKAEYIQDLKKAIWYIQRAIEEAKG